MRVAEQLILPYSFMRSAHTTMYQLRVRHSRTRRAEPPVACSLVAPPVQINRRKEGNRRCR